MTLYKTAVKILKVTLGIQSNKKELLPRLPFKVEVKSLLTDFKIVEKISYRTNLDGYLTVKEARENPSFEFSGEKAIFKGSFLKLTQEASDLRFTLWGNQGFLYRFALYLLEKKHNIYSFHACALYNEKKNALYLIIGGAGSGKTVYLLGGLAKGLKLFSTETVHFRIDNSDISWFMGSLIDNVRFGTLLFDFPQFLPDVETPKLDKVWLEKIALDLSLYKAKFEEIKNLQSVYILFPRIEQGYKGFLLNSIGDKRKAAKALFDNISQKLTETVILYDKIPVPGFYETEMALQRLKNVNRLVQHNSITQIANILSNPNDCWGDILK